MSRLPRLRSSTTSPRCGSSIGRARWCLCATSACFDTIRPALRSPTASRLGRSWSLLVFRSCILDRRSACSGRAHERVEPFGVGAQESLHCRLSYDRGGVGRDHVLLQAWPERGPDVHHQDDGGPGRLARSNGRRHAEASHRADREKAPGNTKARFFAQLHQCWQNDDFRQPAGDTTAREVPDIWYHVRKSVGDMAPTLPAGVVGPGFDDDFGDTFGIIYGFTSNMLIKPLDAVLIEFTNDAARLVVSTRRSDDGIGNLPRQGCEPSGGD